MLVQEGALSARASAGSSAPGSPRSRCRRRSTRCSRRASSACGPRSAPCSSAPRSSAGTSRAAPSPRCCGATASDLDARLEALRRSELIEPDTGWFLGEPVLRFHHVLIRDAAYRRLLKGTRAELHARLADWIEAQVGDAAEHDETIGWHLEQAHQHLRELGPIDATGRALGERAARRLAAAGRRALARDDVPLAAEPARPRPRSARRRRRRRAPTSRSTGARRCSRPATSGRRPPRDRRARPRSPADVRPRLARLAHLLRRPAHRADRAARRCRRPPTRSPRPPTSWPRSATPPARRRRTRCTRRRWRGSARSAPARRRSIGRSPPRAAPAIAAAPTPCSPARRSPRSGDRAR